MRGGSKPIKANRKKSRTAKRPGTRPLQKHPKSAARQMFLNEARDGLARLPNSAAKRNAKRLLKDVTPESSLRSWVLLRDALRDVRGLPALRIDSECRLEHMRTVMSARTGKDIMPVLHSICSNFMVANAELLDYWKDNVLRYVAGRFEKSIRLDGIIKDYVVNMARFGAEPEGDGAFLAMIDEVYAKRGHYFEICDVCEEILKFKDDDALHTLPLFHIEASIAILADNVVASGDPVDGKIAEDCVDILKRRARATKTRVAWPKSKSPTFRTVSKLAHGLVQHRKSKNPSPWISKYDSGYPFMYGEFKREVEPELLAKEFKFIDDRNGVGVLVRIVKKFMRAYSTNCKTLFGALINMMHENKNAISFDSELQRYVIDMARFGSGATDRLVYRTLLHLCIERKAYTKASDICEKMLKFRGADAQRMAGSLIVERVAGDILYYARYSCQPQDGVVNSCVRLLEARSERLGLGRAMTHYPRDNSRNIQAQNFASDIAARRRMHDPERMLLWMEKHYPNVCEFLKIKPRIRKMTSEKKSKLPAHISDLLGIVDLAATRKVDHEPIGGLDELEAILAKMKEEEISTDKDAQQWKDDMRGIGLWNAVLEMDVYARCKITYRNRERGNTSNNAEPYVEPHPKIDGKCADVRVDKCYIEVFAPQERFPSATNRSVEDTIEELCCKIMNKSQVRHFGDRESMLVVKCDENAFSDAHLRELLRTEMKSRLCLGGVLLVVHQDGYYKPSFIENSEAANPVKERTIKEIFYALKKPIAMLKRLEAPYTQARLATERGPKGQAAHSKGNKDSQCSQDRPGHGSVRDPQPEDLASIGLKSWMNSEHLTKRQTAKIIVSPQAVEDAIKRGPEAAAAEARSATESLEQLTLEAIRAIESGIGIQYAQAAAVDRMWDLGRWLDDEVNQRLKRVEARAGRGSGKRRSDRRQQDWDSRYSPELIDAEEMARQEAHRDALEGQLGVFGVAVEAMAESHYADQDSADDARKTTRSLGEQLHEAREACIKAIMEAVGRLEDNLERGE